MEKIPAYLAEERRQIDPARVPKVFAETVSKQNAGLMEIVDTVLLPEVERSGVPRTRFDAALAASIFHYDDTGVGELKKYLDQRNIPVRM